MSTSDINSTRFDGINKTLHMAVQALVEGANTLYVWECDVRDVARAHVLAAEVPSAKGRYLVSHDRTVSDKAVLDLVKERFPQYKWADNAEDSESKRFLSNEKVCCSCTCQTCRFSDFRDRSLCWCTRTLSELLIATAA